jgi:exoribonuclease R
MVSKGNPFPDLDKDTLHRAIAMHPTPMGRSALLTLFGQDEETQEELTTLLAELTKESLITLEPRGYTATAPWADISYALVGNPQPGKRVQVHLLNVPEQDAPVVTLSANDFVQHQLQAGQRIVVGLDRGLVGTGTDLRARFIAAADKSFHLVGVFNQKAQNFAPLDRTIKTDFKLTQANGMTNLPHQFVVELPPDFDPRNPRATIVNDQTRDITTGIAIGDIVASKHGIAKTHSPEALAEAEVLYRSRINYKGRADLRHMDFVTVDPLGSTDLDDAFCATVEKDGYAVYTAIADVPALVLYNTAVDREAYECGSTFYMGDNNTAHMLPDILSTRKTSLIPGHNRPAMIVKQSLNWEGHLVSFDVFAGVIRSRTQLSYGQFYDLSERGDPRFRIINNIHEMRRKNGDNKELEALLKESPGQYSSKSLIETLMVQSNSLMAKFLDASNVPFLSRNLEPGDINNPRAVQRAHYATHRTGHAQLGLLHYAHITSPIRRYADIINMRALHRALGTPDIGMSDEEISNLDKIAAHLNSRRNVERNVSHDMDKYHAIQDLTRVQATPVRVFINEIGQDYVELTIMQTGLRQRLTSATLPANQWRIDSAKQELVMLDDKGNEANRYRQKENILGRIHNVDPARAQWDLKLLPQDNLVRTPAVKTGTGPKPTL